MISVFTLMDEMQRETFTDLVCVARSLKSGLEVLFCLFLYILFVSIEKNRGSNFILVVYLAEKHYTNIYTIYDSAGTHQS